MYKFKTVKGFERHLQRDLHVNLDRYHNESISMPCTCEYEGCRGWATVRESSIVRHIEEELRRHTDCCNVAEYMRLG
jgi:hypothetical protein